MKMKKEMFYLLMLFVSNQISIGGILLFLVEVSGAPLSFTGIVVSSIVVGTFTGGSSCMVIWLYLKLNDVLIFDRDSINRTEFD